MIVKYNHFTTAGEIKAQIEEKNPELEVSECTVHHELTNLSYISIHPRRVSLLTQKAKENRLSWTHNHVNYNWRKVVFSNETTIQIFCNTLPGWSRDAKPIALMVKHLFKVHI